MMYNLIETGREHLLGVQEVLYITNVAPVNAEKIRTYLISKNIFDQDNAAFEAAPVKPIQMEATSVRETSRRYNMAERKDVPYAEFGRRLTELRKHAKMSRAELAEASGVSPSTIVNYERGTRIPYADTAVKMAQVFGMTVEELLGMSNTDIAMARAQADDQMRAINGKKGAERLRAVYAETAASLAGGDLSDDQLMEFTLEMQKMAMLAQQRLNERYTNRRYQATVEAKAEATADAVKVLNEAIAALQGNESR